MNMSSRQNSAYHMTPRSLHIKYFNNNNKICGRAPYNIGHLVILMMIMVDIYNNTGVIHSLLVWWTSAKYYVTLLDIFPVMINFYLLSVFGVATVIDTVCIFWKIKTRTELVALARLFYTPQNMRGGGLRSRSASCVSYAGKVRWSANVILFKVEDRVMCFRYDFYCWRQCYAFSL